MEKLTLFYHAPNCGCLTLCGLELTSKNNYVYIELNLYIDVDLSTISLLSFDYGLIGHCRDPERRHQLHQLPNQLSKYLTFCFICMLQRRKHKAELGSFYFYYQFVGEPRKLRSSEQPPSIISLNNIRLIKAFVFLFRNFWFEIFPLYVLSPSFLSQITNLMMFSSFDVSMLDNAFMSLIIVWFYWFITVFNLTTKSTFALFNLHCFKKK